MIIVKFLRMLKPVHQGTFTVLRNDACRASLLPSACQRGSRQIEALPNAAPVLGADGATAYVLYRRDRFECAKGSELLRDQRLDAKLLLARIAMLLS